MTNRIWNEKEFDKRFTQKWPEEPKHLERFVTTNLLPTETFLAAAEPALIKSFIDSEFEKYREKLIERIEDLKRTEGILGIGGTLHRDSIVNEGFNQTLDDIIRVIKERE